MKKLIVLMLAILPVVAFSQDRGGSTRDGATRDAAARQQQGRNAAATQQQSRGAGSTDAAARDAQREEMRREASRGTASSEIFIEYLLADQGGRQVIRMVKESDILNRLSDKMLQRDLEMLAQRSFSTVADMMTYMGASGWKFVTQFELDVRGQKSYRFVFSRQSPIDPAMITGEKEVPKDAAGEKGGVGANTSRERR